MDDSLLTIKSLSAWYDRERKVLSDFSMELLEHEVVGLIGLNGAGKTTFLKVLSGLLSGFDAEGVWFQGRPVRMREQSFKLCRYTVFDEDHSFQYFTSREYLTYVSHAYGKKLSDVRELVKGFGFERYEDVLLKELSTGNRKKCFLITAFALKPQLLLLDEPVNGLDFQSTEYLYRQISGYREYGTVLFSSHVLESIALTADRVLVLENGQIRRSFEGSRICASDMREALRYEDDI